MSRAKLLSVIVVVILAAVLFSASSCSGRSNFTSSTPTTTEIIKPKPVVEAVDASTSGMRDNYYAILDITVKNDGADGMVVVVASVTQGARTIKNELPIYITHNAKQVVRLVFPLEWEGGDWTPNVRVEIP